MDLDQVEPIGAPDEHTMFSKFESGELAVIDISYLPTDSVYFKDVRLSENLTAEGPWYYFNRLSVPPKIRKRGIAGMLLKEMVVWLDEHKANMLVEVQPYGDLDSDQLEVLYAKHGFHRIATQIMIREYSKQVDSR